MVSKKIQRGLAALLMLEVCLLSPSLAGQESPASSDQEVQFTSRDAMDHFVARRMRAERRRSTFNAAVESEFNESGEAWNTSNFRELLAEIDRGPIQMEGVYQVPDILAPPGTPYLPEYAALRILRPARSVVAARQPTSKVSINHEQDTAKLVQGESTPDNQAVESAKNNAAPAGQDDKEFGHRVKNFGGKVKGFFKEKF